MNEVDESQTLDRIAELLSRETGLPGVETFKEMTVLVRESGREVGPPEPATTCPVCHAGNVKADVTVTLELVGTKWVGRSVWETPEYFCTNCEAEYDGGAPDADEFIGPRSAVLIGMGIKE